VFHVAGTNGKGSTCAFLRAALEASGHKVHVFTSPHLVRFNERIRIAGRLIEDDLLAALLKEVREASEDIEPSFFEATTAVAFLAFARTPADVAIVEVGLGGRLDATNVIDKPLVCGIAGLGLDHQQFLGRRMIDIADEKAGIARRGVPLVTQLYPDKIRAAAFGMPKSARAGCTTGTKRANWHCPSPGFRAATRPSMPRSPSPCSATRTGSRCRYRRSMRQWAGPTGRHGCSGSVGDR
jgi:dihydrofolate synthase/folylpolyglutamate synthase